jgi:UDP-N-acetylglucosamine 1-carboxyvinyltransferase
MTKFIVRGGKRLSGKVRVSGSKNAALPIMAATLLTREKCVLRNVPRIGDVFAMIRILTSLGSEISFEGNILEIQTKEIKICDLPIDEIKKMRASILLLAPLVALGFDFSMPFPGGCVLGQRSLATHFDVFRSMGAQIHESEKGFEVKPSKLSAGKFVLDEMSVTATENAATAASKILGKTEISLAAVEPHVVDLCKFLQRMGAQISGVGTHTLTIDGVSELKGCEHEITGDYLEAGTLALSAVVTGGEVEITDFLPEDLQLFWLKLKELGAKVEFGADKKTVKVSADKNQLKAISGIKTAVHPGFPTDLQAPFAVALTQAQGQSMVFETLFEGRLNYLFELEKLGAKVEILNPHQALIQGVSRLKAIPISSCDIRAGAAMVLAALAAEGETEISNIIYIDRGYEDLAAKLTQLGAEIKRI